MCIKIGMEHPARPPKGAEELLALRKKNVEIPAEPEPDILKDCVR